MKNSSTRRPLLPFHFDFFLLAAFASVLLSLSWRRWAHPYVDFGREVYTAWQISEGALFGRDIFNLFGPWSGHFNGALFQLFGPGLDVLFSANFLILILIVVLNHHLLLHFASKAAACLASLVFLGAFAFNQVSGGSFNFMAPYSHEVTHGVAMSLASFFLFFLGAKDRKPIFFLSSGILFGAVLLTKFEVSLALGVAVPFLFLLAKRAGILRAAFPTFVLGALILPISFFTFYAVKTDWDNALRVCLSPLLYPLNSTLANSPFYARVMGTDHPRVRLWAMVAYGSKIMGFLVILLGMDHLFLKRLRDRRFFWFVSIGLGLGVFVALSGRGFWRHLPVALPLLVISALLIRFRGARKDFEFALVYGVFSCALLFKVFLNVRIFTYGFALAVPAMTFVLAHAFDLFPRGRSLGRYSVVGAVAAMLVYYLSHSLAFWNERGHLVGSGRDQIYFSPVYGEHLQSMLSKVGSLVAKSETVTIIPEGQLVNYFTRRRSSVAVTNLLPPEFEILGPRNIRSEFERSPPDFIVQWPRRMTEYGKAGFGLDYGEDLAEWIRRNYRAVSVDEQAITVMQRDRAPEAPLLP